MRRSRGGAAFYVETLLLVLFLLASLTVLVQILGAAKRTSREARELSTAVSIAQNAAELFAASGSQEDFAALLGAEKTARGTLRAAYDVQGGWKHRGLTSWKQCWTKRRGRRVRCARRILL